MKRTWRTVLALFIVAALAAPGWSAGKAAPDFTLKDVLQGNDYTLSQFKGKVVLINFFTFFCGPCREEMPDDGSAHPHLLLAGIAQTMVAGRRLEAGPLLARTSATSTGADAPPIPRLFTDVAEALRRQRATFEAGDVVPAHVIDRIADALASI